MPEVAEVEAGIETAEVFDVSGLFDDDDAAPAAAVVDEQPVYDEPVDDSEIDGPQPGDDLDEPPLSPADETPEVADDDGEIEQAAELPADVAPTPPLTLDEYEQERRDAADRVAEAALAQAEAVAATKAAKKRFEAALEDLQDVIDRGPEDRPLFDKPVAPQPAASPAVLKDESDADGAMFDDNEIAANLTSDAVNAHLRPPLAAGEIRIVLLREIVDEHPTRGTLTWAKGTELVARVDSSGGTIIPFADDPTDGTGLEAEEFDVLEDPRGPVDAEGQPLAESAAPLTDDARLDTPLADTAIPTGILAKLKESGIITVRDMANWTAGGKQFIDVKGIGQGKAEKIEAAMEEFWKRGAK